MLWVVVDQETESRACSVPGYGQGRLLAKAFTQGVVRMEVKIGSKKIKRNGSFGCPGN